ncbi:hypothetical protein PIB30_055771 [Stylosanthes scabra]|uniref:PGG domain-containing protein n=1 Tax=Stylosanthes scabra TaxID=79078 RepID=A0ABU6XH03_9FABA|nr:hypothetical protein [Stylosanthes scabra]
MDMDPNLFEAIRKNDIATFSSLLKENEGILNQKTADSHRTPLHIASRYGCNEIVSEIISLCPDMVSVENKKHETPIHEAGKRMLSHGHLDMVNLLLNLPEMEEPSVAGFDQTCILIAASRGHTDIVRELLNKWPELVQVIDEDGNSPLHHACKEGYREIIWILLRRDPKMALQYNNNGYTPLHLAVKNGRVSVLEDFVSSCAASFHYLTTEEETVFHIAVRYGCYDALEYLVRVSNGTNLLHCQDRYGNSVLHLAVTGGRHKIADFLISKTKLDINTRNSEGFTALDILEKAKDTAENRQLQAIFIRAGGKRSIQSSSSALEGDRANFLSPIASRLSLSRRYLANELEMSQEMISIECTSPPELSKSADSRSPQQPQISERFEYLSPKSLGKHKHQSQKKMENLNQLYYAKRSKHMEMHKEALLNARNTIILVAVLIATVTFSAGISPPGGVYQEGPMMGKSMVGNTTAFKIFAISNDIALFTSLSIVIVLVSIIPFKRKPHMRLLSITHKIMWVAIAFMASGYVTATWVILPHSEGMQWLSVMLIALGGGSLGTIFIGLAVMLVEHWLRKSRWKKTRKEGANSDGGESQNSDVESSYLHGYHSY